MARILTYNVHRCLGTDGRLSPERIAEVIAACRPDVVALQELDVGRTRSGGIDQAHAIARELDMRHVYFNPALRVLEEEYGDALITARPSKLVKMGPLPRHGRAEPRGALWATVQIGGVEVQVITTHLGLRRPERLAQVDALLGPEWLSHAACRGPAVLLGDFNAVPRSRAYQRLTARMQDAQAHANVRHPPRSTFPSRLPLFRIDHAFVSRSVHVVRAEVVHTPLARTASDHLPLLIEIRVDGTGAHHAPALGPQNR
jgi:endonuclease/exonuclease/phosphatase family metal-dependent hydrolase